MQIIGAAYDLQHPGEFFGYGDISRQGGGPFPPHGCHENGLDVDVWYPNINGTWQQTDLSVPSQLANFDRARMLNLLNAFATAVGPASQHMVAGFILSEQLEPVPPPGTPNPNAIGPGDLLRSVPITYDHDDPSTPNDNEDDHRHHFHVTLVDEDGPDAPCY
jgi:hypothetical protein